LYRRKHVLPAHLARDLAEPRCTAFARGLPRGALRVRELLVDGRVCKALETVARPEQLHGKIGARQLLVEDSAMAAVLEVGAREPQLGAAVGDVRRAARERERQLFVDVDVDRHVVGKANLGRELLG